MKPEKDMLGAGGVLSGSWFRRRVRMALCKYSKRSFS